MLKTRIIIAQSVAIAALLIGVALLLRPIAAGKAVADEPVIYRLDKADLARVERLVRKFGDGYGDNLMIVSPTLDSGPYVHDVMSNGREIRWVVDPSRDGWTVDKGKTEYDCGAIRMHDRDPNYIDVQLSRCSHHAADEQLTVLTFSKEDL
ncbi:protein of unknown function [Paenibacillus sp. UNC496MF]|uniref:DUF4362 domain-containing protein n=1 Tax=Paenibacillus sp. UNC496MF TaxID=1502753 RepID=UPI0008E7A931|nr:DUF4362 domain-containing protein [Paenibacillus sp. UNC496MF]SFJ13147.1 protein of unknown function [Paenibacillus sp. UNC496MF]